MLPCFIAYFVLLLLNSELATPDAMVMYCAESTWQAFFLDGLGSDTKTTDPKTNGHCRDAQFRPWIFPSLQAHYTPIGRKTLYKAVYPC